METEIRKMQKDLDFDIQALDIPDLPAEDKDLIYFFIEVTRYIQELEKLFKVYRYNLNMMLSLYTLNNDDTVECNIDTQDSDYITINALVINLVSSAKILMESIESFIRFINGCLEGQNNMFKEKHISKAYDENFSYRFLLFLRNYSQHGHLPVSSSVDKKFYFDLDKILSTPHFGIKKNIGEELDCLIQEIHIKYDDYPRLVFTKTIVDFNFFVHKLYFEFYESIEDIFNEIIESMNELMKDNPEIIHHSQDALDGYVFYKDDTGKIHCYNANENPRKMFANLKKEAMFYWDNEREEKEKFDKSIRFK